MVSKMSEVEPQKKRKRVSKKNKKAWRKHTDIKDVERFLDDKRLEERLGKPFAERADTELFLEDKVARDKKAKKVVRLTRKQRLLKPIKCFQILENTSAVPVPIITRSQPKNPDQKRHLRLKKALEARRAKGIPEKNSVKERRHKKTRRPRSGVFEHDLWGEDTAEKMEKKLKSVCDPAWIERYAVLHVNRNTGHAKINMPRDFLKKPYTMPATENPHPGTSYNPTYEDHQELLQEVVDLELADQKKARHLNRVVKKVFTPVLRSEAQKNWLAEMSQGLPNSKEVEMKEEEEYDDEVEGVKRDPSSLSVNPPVQNKKKTLKERRKQKEHKMADLQQLEQKSEKKKLADIYKLKFLNQDIAEKESKWARVQEKRKKAKDAKAKGTKLLGKVKYQSPDPDFNLKNEISGSLRSLQPQGSLAKDRFNSFQKRNLIEPRVKIFKQNKAKVKRSIKHSHKIDTELKAILSDKTFHK